MTFKVPESRRLTAGNSNCPPALVSDESHGNNGAFMFTSNGDTMFCIASDGLGWEHVSVSVGGKRGPRLPTWEEMCLIKLAFWGPEDCVVQYHPPESDYVNCHKHTLHLWRPVGGEFPRPDSILVGPKR